MKKTEGFAAKRFCRLLSLETRPTDRQDA